MEPAEEFEHIPWAQLAVERSAGRNRLAYLAAGVLVALAVGAVVARAVWKPGDAGAVITPAATVTAPAAEGGFAGPPEAMLPTPPPPLDGQLVSEADLMAAIPLEDTAGVAARAEWFVIDYFTADRDPLGSLPIRTALPASADLPQLPQDGEAGGIGYVEWAKAYRVETIEPGLFRVSVAFRSVGAVGDEPFFRLPLRAVEVVVSAPTVGSAMGIVDLPSPARVPGDIGFSPWPAVTPAVPAPIAEAALEMAGPWGADAQVAGGAPAGTGWRVVVVVGDEVGNRWPLSLWLDETGRLAAPPWGEEG